MVRLLYIFKIYTRVVLRYTHIDVAPKLAIAFSDYRMSLLELATTYITESIRDYYHVFVYTRIVLDQEDIKAWLLSDAQAKEKYLERSSKKTSGRTRNETNPFFTQPASQKRRFNSCDNWNRDISCRATPYNYPHEYSQCRGNHPVNRYSSSISAANTILLESRVSKP